MNIVVMRIHGQSAAWMVANRLAVADVTSEVMKGLANLHYRLAFGPHRIPLE